MHALGLAKPPDKRRLGPRQVRRQAFVKAYTDSQSPTFANATKSAQSAGFAASSGNALLRDEQVREMIFRALEHHGVTEDFLADGIKEGLRAEEVRLATHEGKFTDERKIPDWNARAKFQQIAHQLRGDFPREELVQQAALIVQLPPRELVKGHGAFCRCKGCEQAWEEMTATKGLNESESQ